MINLSCHKQFPLLSFKEKQRKSYLLVALYGIYIVRYQIRQSGLHNSFHWLGGFKSDRIRKERLERLRLNTCLLNIQQFHRGGFFITKIWNIMNTQFVDQFLPTVKMICTIMMSVYLIYLLNLKWFFKKKKSAINFTLQVATFAPLLRLYLKRQQSKIYRLKCFSVQERTNKRTDCSVKILSLISLALALKVCPWVHCVSRTETTHRKAVTD